MLLYKYRSLDGNSIKFTHDIIRKQEVYFSRPDNFNDPFEFRPRFSLKSTRAEYANYLEGLFKKKLPHLNRKRRSALVSEVVHDKTRNNESPEAIRAIEEGGRQLISMCGVFCLSADPLSILMWSHYGDNHRGICIGFDASTSNPFFGRAQEVLYRNDYPVANIIKDSPDLFQDKIALTKSSHWAYEREWRIVEHERGSGIYKFDKRDLKQIVFGAKTLQSEIEAISTLLSEANIKPELFQARLHDERYEIVATPL